MTKTLFLSAACTPIWSCSGGPEQGIFCVEIRIGRELAGEFYVTARSPRRGAPIALARPTGGTPPSWCRSYPSIWAPGWRDLDRREAFGAQASLRQLDPPRRTTPRRR